MCSRILYRYFLSFHSEHTHEVSNPIFKATSNERAFKNTFLVIQLYDKSLAQTFELHGE